MAIQARLTIMAAEVAAVLDRRWWPRSIRNDDLERSDRRTLRAHAQREVRVPSQVVRTRFETDRSDAASPATKGGTPA
jgi:hypothetical protein